MSEPYDKRWEQKNLLTTWRQQPQSKTLRSHPPISHRLQQQHSCPMGAWLQEGTIEALALGGFMVSSERPPRQILRQILYFGMGDVLCEKHLTSGRKILMWQVTARSFYEFWSKRLVLPTSSRPKMISSARKRPQNPNGTFYISYYFLKQKASLWPIYDLQQFHWSINITAQD